jgi:hypothetical protein
MRRAVLVIVTIVAMIGVAIQIVHRVNYGHLVPLGLHADYTIETAEIGIPGISKLYDAHLTNYGALPSRIERCQFTTDASEKGVSIGYKLQRLDSSTHSWRTLMDVSGIYCQPYPLGMAQTRLASKLLWPGQKLSIGPEATGARGRFKGERLRFVVVAGGRDFPTQSFIIDEEMKGTDVGYRVRH